MVISGRKFGNLWPTCKGSLMPPFKLTQLPVAPTNCYWYWSGKTIASRIDGLEPWFMCSRPQDRSPDCQTHQIHISTWTSVVGSLMVTDPIVGGDRPHLLRPFRFMAQKEGTEWGTHTRCSVFGSVCHLYWVCVTNWSSNIESPARGFWQIQLCSPGHCLVLI